MGLNCEGHLTGSFFSVNTYYSIHVAGKDSTCNAGDPSRALGREDPLEKG